MIPARKEQRMTLGKQIGYAGTAVAVLVLAGLGGATAQQQQPPCFNEFMPLRSEAEKHGKSIQAAAKRKAPPSEVCGLFKRFAVAEAKMINYAEANAAWCGIPADALKQMKTQHAQTIKIRGQVCAAAAAPRPRGPSLGDALGTTIVPNDATTRTGRGTYDTLTGGNPSTR
jgi:hypothetical protein